jgi:membrane protein DedA with SNARE-associated domain
MVFSFAPLIASLETYKYIALLPIVVIEGPVATVLAGFLSSMSYLSLGISYVIVVLGDLVGDMIYYALGYWGRGGIIEKYGSYVGITGKRLSQLEAHFQDHAGKTLLLGKLTHGIGIVALIAAGTARVPFIKFLWYNLVATLPKSLILLLVGFYFGEAYMKLSRYLDYTAVIALIIPLLLGVYVLIRSGAPRYHV